MVLITPVGLVAAVMALAPAAGLRRVFHRPIDRKHAFVVVYTLTPLSVFVAFSLVHAVKLNWTGPLWLAVLPALAQMLAAERRLLSFRMTALWAATIPIALILYGAGLHYLALGLPGVPYPNSLGNLPIAWREFADTARQIKERVQSTTGHKPLLVGMDRYFLSSELAFYDRESGDSVQNTAGRSLFGGNSLMYNYWISRCRQTGRTVLMFGFYRRQLYDQHLSKWFQELGPITEHMVYKAGTPAGRFYYRVGYDYRPECAGELSPFASSGERKFGRDRMVVEVASEKGAKPFRGASIILLLLSVQSAPKGGGLIWLGALLNDRSSLQPGSVSSKSRRRPRWTRSSKPTRCW